MPLFPIKKYSIKNIWILTFILLLHFRWWCIYWSKPGCIKARFLVVVCLNIVHLLVSRHVFTIKCSDSQIGLEPTLLHFGQFWPVWICITCNTDLMTQNLRKLTVCFCIFLGCHTIIQFLLKSRSKSLLFCFVLAHSKNSILRLWPE